MAAGLPNPENRGPPATVTSIAVPRELKLIGHAILESAGKVHATLGPGLLETVYEVCLSHELQRRGLRVLRQVPMPVMYEELRFHTGMRLDLLVEDAVIVEIKTTERLHPVHEAQLLTYLKLTGRQLGYLITFNVSEIRSGIRRIIL